MRWSARLDQLGRSARDDENIVVAEVDENTDLYEEGHIPGAVKLHWHDDLQDPVERDIVEKADFEALIGARGIGNNTTVVLYGDKNNWFAAYAYWYLKIYGHEDVRIIDGGRKWIDEGRELTTEAPTWTRRRYTAQEARRVDPRLPRGRARTDRQTAATRWSTSARPDEYTGEVIAPPGYEQEGGSARRPHPGREDDPLGEGGQRRRHVQVGRRAAASSTTARASRRTRRSSPTAASASARAHTWFVLHDSWATRTSATTTAPGPNGETSLTPRSNADASIGRNGIRTPESAVSGVLRAVSVSMLFDGMPTPFGRWWLAIPGRISPVFANASR